MFEFKTILGAVAVFLSIAGLLPYISDIVKKKSKPHLYTWLVWTPLTFIAFFAQVSGGAGPGAWTTGVSAALCLVILALSFFRGTKDITRTDNVSLVSAALVTVFWITTKDALVSIVLVTIIDVLGFVPTIRKSIKNPHEETLITHQLSGAKHFISIFALTSVSIITALYPAALIVANAVLVGAIIYGRKKHNKS